MKYLFNISAVTLLLFSTLGICAQKVIKSIDITVALPKNDDPTYDRCNVTAITTDAFGRQEDFTMGQGLTWGVNMLEFNDYGERQQIHEQEFMAGREYILQVIITNFTDKNFNYKNDKNFTVDNTTIKATVNGKPTKIVLGSPRSITTDFIFTVPGERNKWYTSVTPSPADGKLNGYEYVDLGLPSGNLWATCNVGAAKPEDFGDFFGWGETKTKKTFTDKNFVGYGAYLDTNPFNIQTFMQEDMKYSVEGGPIAGRRLKFEYDAARQNMGGEWRIPTKNMHSELDEYCEIKFIKLNGVPGTLWISRINGKSIFTPYSGTINGDEKILRGEQGFLWTSNGHRVHQMQVNIWGSQYNSEDAKLRNDPRTGKILGSLGRGAIEAPEMGLPIRAVWINGSKTSKSERKQKAKEANKARKDNQEREYQKTYGEQYEDSDAEYSNDKSADNQNGTTEKKEKKKSKTSLKSLLNKGKSIFNILK